MGSRRTKISVVMIVVIVAAGVGIWFSSSSHIALTEILPNGVQVSVSGTSRVTCTAYCYINYNHIRLGSALISVEYAINLGEWQLGLSGRSSLAPDSGMLFIFPEPMNWAFWMQGMKFPLDIIWIDSNRQVIGITSDISTCSSQCSAYYPPAPYSYVLEVNAGYAAKHGIKIGSQFSWA